MDKIEFYNAIEDLIKENLKTYTDSPKRFISDYNREIESVKEYNGRQILELLQNADDADSNEVQIKIEKDEKRLTISNKGEAFSVGGIESLMMANLSTKTKKRYIGNKGLGFRSVLNWADKIIIKTNGCLVEFSPDIAAKEFTKLAVDSKIITSIIKERGLSEKAIPFPILSIPDIKIDNRQENEWTTIIEIYYKQEFEDKIILQLKECTEEILLFLNNISKINIEGLKDEEILFERIKLQEDQLSFIQIKEKVWRVETIEDFLPDYLQDKNKTEKEFYNITIAFQDDLSDKYYKLFNYFPTKLSVYLPCIIHATFEVNSSRDYLNESAKNEFIFGKLTELLKSISLKLSIETEGNSDWRPLKLILPVKNETSSNSIKKFYESLKKIQTEIQIYPCLDGKYKRLYEIYYYGIELSEWVNKNNFNQNFTNLLCPEDNYILKYNNIPIKYYPNELFIKIIDSIGAQSMELHVRAELISLLLDPRFNVLKGEKFSLLVNNNSDNDVIEKSNVAYTPIIEGEKVFHKPEFINIDFINVKLYKILCEKHANKIASSEIESRGFQSLFRDILNVQAYDSKAVLTRIITGTRKQISNINVNESKTFVKNMIYSLFQNYKSLKNAKDIFTDNCPLINKAGNICESNNLFLSSSFPSGVYTEQIYKGILDDEYYVNDSNYYGLENEDSTLIELFFIWLGVNKFAKVNKIEFEKQSWENYPYLNYVFEKIPRPNPVSRYFFKGKEIGLFEETVAKLSNEKLIYLIFKEQLIYQRLSLINLDEFSYQYSNSYPTIPVKPSYISFQLQTLNRFKNYLIENNEIPFINIEQIDYNNPIFKESGIKEYQINDILEKLGAIRSIVDLSTEKVFDLIEKSSTISEQKYIRKLYLLAFEHFKNLKTNIKLSLKPETKLLAIKNGIKDFREISEIYYSDNSTLPEKITRNLWIFDFPKRAGEIQISRFFGLKTFKELELKIMEDSSVIHPQTNEFNNWFTYIKPLILTYRISNLKKTTEKRDAASALKRCSIQLVSKSVYSIDNESKLDLDFEEFLRKDENQFIICIESYKKLEHFKNSSKFCSTFAEIMCILFKVNESKNNYINIFKDNFDFSKDLILADSLDEYLTEAYSLLGLSQNETIFWRTIFKIKKCKYEEIENEQELNRLLKNNLQYKLPDCYEKVDFENFANKESFDFLKSLNDELKLSLIEIHSNYSSFSGLKKWHIEKLQNTSWDVEKIYTKTLWKILEDKSRVEQQNFIKQGNKFRDWFNNNKWENNEIDSFVFEINYYNILIEKVKLILGSEILSDENSKTITIHSDYNELLSKHDEIEKSFTDEQRSLLYFKGYLEEISEIIVQLTAKSKSKEIIPESKNGQFSPIIEINFTNSASNLLINKLNGFRKRRSVVDPHKEKNKRQIGKKAERKVRDSLIEKYGRNNVQWVSGNSDENIADDTLGYDIRYREVEQNDWFFLEVKSVSNDYFIISYLELDTAFKNKSKYHLALFKFDKIYIDKEYFNKIELENEFKKINSGFFIKPYDYEISINLPNEIEQIIEL